MYTGCFVSFQTYSSFSLSLSVDELANLFSHWFGFFSHSEVWKWEHESKHRKKLQKKVLSAQITPGQAVIHSPASNRWFHSLVSQYQTNHSRICLEPTKTTSSKGPRCSCCCPHLSMTADLPKQIPRGEMNQSPIQPD